MSNPKKSRLRHLLKAFTWRFIASGTTFLLAWFFFQDDAQAVQKATSIAIAESVLKMGLDTRRVHGNNSGPFSKATSIAIAESVLKMGLYYFHERAWYRYGKLGRDAK